MQPEVKVGQARQCPSCGHPSLQSRHIRDEFEYGPDDERVRIVAESVPVLVCPQCGETLYGPEAARVRHQAICRALRLLTPEQIKAMRERLGRNQAEFAQLTGIGVATLSRWERGRLLQTRALDRYLRLIDSFSDAILVLERLNASVEAQPVFQCLNDTPEVRAREASYLRRTAADAEPTNETAAPVSKHTPGQ